MSTRITVAEAATLGIESTSRYDLMISRITARRARRRGLKLSTTARKKGVIFARLVVPSE